MDRLIRVGSRQSRLYKQFPGKDDVAAAYLRRMVDRWRRHARSAALAADDDPRKQLFGLFVTLEQAVREDTLGCAFVNAVAEYQPGGPVHAVAAGHQHAVHACVRDLPTAADATELDTLVFQLTLLVDGTPAATRVQNTGAVAARQGRVSMGLSVRADGDNSSRSTARRARAQAADPGHQVIRRTHYTFHIALASVRLTPTASLGGQRATSRGSDAPVLNAAVSRLLLRVHRDELGRGEPSRLAEDKASA